MTISDLMRFIHEQVLAALAKKDQQELAYLGTTVQQLLEAAERYHDSQLHSLLDDMNYLLNETLMGAQAKGEKCLPSITEKLAQLEREENSRK
jgi:hypothetical protein